MMKKHSYLLSSLCFTLVNTPALQASTQSRSTSHTLFTTAATVCLASSFEQSAEQEKKMAMATVQDIEKENPQSNISKKTTSNIPCSTSKNSNSSTPTLNSQSSLSCKATLPEPIPDPKFSKSSIFKSAQNTSVKTYNISILLYDYGKGIYRDPLKKEDKKYEVQVSKDKFLLDLFNFCEEKALEDNRQIKSLHKVYNWKPLVNVKDIFITDPFCGRTEMPWNECKQEIRNDLVIEELGIESKDLQMELFAVPKEIKNNDATKQEYYVKSSTSSLWLFLKQFNPFTS